MCQDIRRQWAESTTIMVTDIYARAGGVYMKVKTKVKAGRVASAVATAESI
jgi:hypothetical protein